MNVIKTAIEGVVIIVPRVFKDGRGYFFESFSQREFDEKVRKVSFVQDNESMSSVLCVDYTSSVLHLHKASWFVV